MNEPADDVRIEAFFEVPPVGVTASEPAPRKLEIGGPAWLSRRDDTFQPSTAKRLILALIDEDRAPERDNPVRWWLTRRPSLHVPRDLTGPASMSSVHDLVGQINWRPSGFYAALVDVAWLYERTSDLPLSGVAVTDALAAYGYSLMGRLPSRVPVDRERLRKAERADLAAGLRAAAGRWIRTEGGATSIIDWSSLRRSADYRATVMDLPPAPGALEFYAPRNVP